MSTINDEVHLAKKCKHWPLDLAEKLLASPLPWGPRAYLFGIGYTGDSEQPDQHGTFIELAHCVDGAYERHGGDMEETQNWAVPIMHKLKEGGSCVEYTTQDLLDIVFLYVRSERFSEGLIHSEESTLREIMQEVVRRIHSSTPPVFLTKK